MPAKRRPKKMGRPQKQIDGRTVLKMAKLAATLDEIASVVGCSPDTLDRRFRAELDRGWSAAKQTLRRRQWALSKQSKHLPSACTMSIWLGKQILQQRDKFDVKMDDEQVNGAIERLLAKAHAHQSARER